MVWFRQAREVKGKGEGGGELAGGRNQQLRSSVVGCSVIDGAFLLPNSKQPLV